MSLSTATLSAGAGVLRDRAAMLRDTKKGTLCGKEKITKTQLEQVAEMRDVTLSEIFMISKELYSRFQ
jgi:hypothetical protein